MSIINLDMYLAAYAGAIAGMISSNKVLFNPNAVTYTNLILAAAAFAEEFDLVWGDATQANVYEIETAQSISEAAWQERTPFTTLKFEEPAVYQTLCQALIAVINGGMEYLTSQGITPPDPGGNGLPSGGDVIIDPNDNTKNIVQAISGNTGDVAINAAQFNYSGNFEHFSASAIAIEWIINSTFPLTIDESGIGVTGLTANTIEIAPLIDNMGGLDTSNTTHGNTNTGIENWSKCTLAPDGTEQEILRINNLVTGSVYRIDVTIDVSESDGAHAASWGLRIFATNFGSVIAFWGSPDPLFSVGNNAGAVPVGWTVGFDQDGGDIIVLATTSTGALIMCNAQFFKVQG